MPMIASSALLMIWFCSSVRADLNPKPSMTFNLVYRTAGHPEIQGWHQFVCEDAQCQTHKALEAFGGLSCGPAPACWSAAYGYPKYHRLVLDFSDKTRTSNVFANEDFISTYAVYVGPDDLVVEKTDGYDIKHPEYDEAFVEELLVKGVLDRHVMKDLFGFKWAQAALVKFRRNSLLARFAVALALTVILELAAAWVVLRRHARRRRLLLTLLSANLVSLPGLWLFCVGSDPSRFWIGVLLAELCVVGFEGLWLFGFNRDSLSLGRALALSLFFNGMSYIGGTTVADLMPNQAVRELLRLEWSLRQRYSPGDARRIHNSPD